MIIQRAGPHPVRITEFFRTDEQRETGLSRTRCSRGAVGGGGLELAFSRQPGDPQGPPRERSAARRDPADAGVDATLDLKHPSGQGERFNKRRAAPGPAARRPKRGAHVSRGERACSFCIFAEMDAVTLALALACRVQARAHVLREATIRDANAGGPPPRDSEVWRRRQRKRLRWSARAMWAVQQVVGRTGQGNLSTGREAPGIKRKVAGNRNG
jgi:hypothetical protein